MGGGGGRRSDLRLKHDIVLVGRLDDGLGYYRFVYNTGHTAYVGVMAQEVQRVAPQAVTLGHDGYLRVDYDLLGLPFETYKRWVITGAHLPSVKPVRECDESPEKRRLPNMSRKFCARPALAASLLVVLGANVFAAQAPYVLVRLSDSPSYSAAYGRVNQQLTVLQSRRTGSTRRAKCRNEEAIHWLAAQSEETAAWRVAASERRQTDSLTTELKIELAAQSRLKPCKRRIT